MYRHFSRWRCSMAEYIEKQSALNAILREPPDAHYPSWYAERIKALPAADVVPVVHGRWIQVDSTKCRCSHCDIIALIALYPHGDKNFCPNCGAKMNGGTK